MKKTIAEYEGHEYEMGAGFSEVRKGDVVQLKDGKLEVILSVIPLRNWEGVSIHTESGTHYSFLPNSISGYGKRIS